MDGVITVTINTLDWQQNLLMSVHHFFEVNEILAEAATEMNDGKLRAKAILLSKLGEKLRYKFEDHLGLTNSSQAQGLGSVGC